MKSDGDLLRDYAETHSEDAFAELVRRHLDLVYSTALRQVNGDVPLAQDVAQTVFADLARKVGSLSGRSVLTGWLYTSTHFAAAKAVRTERRRQAHEQEAQAMRELLHDPALDPDWDRLRPILDAAMLELQEADREAVLLRYFERRPHAEIGAKLGVSENTARMRVERALEKLRAHLAGRGVTTTAAALSTAISTNAVQAAPISLGATITTAATLALSSFTPVATATATKAIAMTALQKTLIAATLVATISTGLYETRQASRWRTQAQTIEQQQALLDGQITQLKSDNEALSNRVAHANQSPSLSSERLRELLRLRGEVGMLKRQQRELEQAAVAAASKTLPGQPTSVAALPAPLQMQLVLDGPGENTETLTNSAGGASGETLHVQKSPLLDYTAIRAATVSRDVVSGAPQIDVEFNEVGKELFAAVTKENINKRLAIVLNGQLYSAPVIRSEIPGGKAQITGSFTEEEARALAAKINDAISGK